MNNPLYQQLTNRAVELMGDDVSFERAVSRARGEFELSRNQELEEAIFLSLELWSESRKEKAIQEACAVLGETGRALRAQP